MMKHQKLFLPFLFLALGLALFQGCTEDGDDPIIPTDGPDLRLLTGSGGVSDGDIIETGSTFTIRVSGTAGDTPMETVGIYEENSLIAVNRITVNGTSVNTNPFLLSSSEAQSFTFNIGIRSVNVEETNTYVVEVVDTDGKDDFVELDITTADPGTPVVEMTGLQLFNAGGPVGTGGLNLKTGESVGSGSAGAQIRDQGINTDLPPAQNWRQMISGVNGSTLRIPGAGMLYDDFEVIEEIIEAYDAGAPVTVTEKLEVGDLIIVKQGNDHFLLLVSDVVLTSDDNNDYYMFDVKK